MWKKNLKGMKNSYWNDKKWNSAQHQNQKEGKLR